MALYDEGRAAYYVVQYGLLEAAGYTLQFAAERAKSSAAWFTARANSIYGCLAAMHGDPIPQFPPARNIERLLTK